MIEMAERRQKELAEDEAEFKLIETYIVGRIVSSGDYRRFANVADYVEHRDKHFGSRSEYLRFAAEADGEMSSELRRIIDKPPGGSEQAQAIFYCWLRKAYKTKYGVDKNVPQAIITGREFYIELEKLVKGNITADLKPAFNPRPERKMAKDGQYRYLLGTVSGHTLGIAVDLDPAKNPDVQTAAWDFMMHFVGKQFTRDLNRWITDPKGLDQDVRNLSDGFKTKLAEEVRLVQTYQQLLKKVESTNPQSPGGDDLNELAAFQEGDKWPLYLLRKRGLDPCPGSQDIDKYISGRGGGVQVGQKLGPRFVDSDPLDLVLEVALANYQSTNKPSKESLKALRNGFFNLKPEVVTGFHTYGFTWGITFPQPDLMHFQQDGRTPGLGSKP